MSSEKNSKIESTLHEQRIFAPINSKSHKSSIPDFAHYEKMVRQYETDPDEYEDKSARIKYVDAKHDLKEVTTDEEEFREWDGIEEDWQEFNRKHIKDENKPK